MITKPSEITTKMSSKLLSTLVILGVLAAANASTDELLQCRANLTADIKNELIFGERVKQADYIFTGKIREIRAGRLVVKVKRAIKGRLDEMVELQTNDTCANYVRHSYTGIFMGRLVQGNRRAVMHFGPVPLTLANLDRLNAAIKGIGLD